jgi:pseudaminic acid cytidylyltransferase
MKIAIIPARGGSKRIPRKNILNFMGKPLIAYSIEAAIDSKLFDRIIVSTDDPEIATIAKEWGAETPFVRPLYLADDMTGTNEVVKHAIQWHNNHVKQVEIACCIYATAPLVTPQYLQKGLDILTATKKSYALSVTRFSSAIQRAIRLSKEGAIELLHPNYINTRTQDLEENYHDAGQFCWGWGKSYLNSIPILSNQTVPVILPRYLVQDIDTMEDWYQAELMYKIIQQSVK